MSNNQFEMPEMSELVMVLTAYINGQYLPFGSCVSIGQNLVLTATHVLEEFHKQAGGKILLSLGERPTFPVYALQFMTRGTEPAYRMWIVRELFCFENADDERWKSDLMVMRIEQLSGATDSFTFPKIRMDLKNPEIASSVFSLGYPSTLAVRQADIFNIYAKLFQATGQVEVVHLDKRDSVVLPFPCFQANFNILGGMSGGPVFNDQGSLCGINCTSYSVDPSTGMEQYTSYVSLLWPLVMFAVNLGPLARNTERSRSLIYSLIETNQLEANGMEIYEATKNSDGEITDVVINLVRGKGILGSSNQAQTFNYNLN